MEEEEDVNIVFKVLLLILAAVFFVFFLIPSYIYNLFFKRNAAKKLWFKLFARPPKFKLKDNVSIKEWRKEIGPWLNLLHQKKFFSGNVLVIEEGETIYKDFIGFLSHNKEERFNGDTPFISFLFYEHFLVICIMILKNQGKISYDDSVKNYIEEFPFDDITIRDLLCKTSGLGSHRFSFEKNERSNVIKAIVKNKDKIDKKRKKKPTLSILRREYDNHSLLYLLELVSEQSIFEFIDENIKIPFELNSLQIILDKEEYSPINCTKRIDLIEDKMIDFDEEFCVYISLNDIEKWFKLLFSGEILSEEFSNDAFKHVPFNEKYESTGFFGGLASIKQKKQHSFWGMYELSQGSYLGFHLDKKDLIVVLGNTRVKRKSFNKIIKALSRNKNYENDD